MGSVTNWLADLKTGSRTAYARLFERFFPRLVARAGRHLNGLPAKQTDAEDVALSAFQGFGREVDDKSDVRDRLTDRDSLWQFLTLLTFQEARRTRRYETQQKRDCRRTATADAAGATADPRPDPQDEVAARDLTEAWLKPLSLRHQEIVGLKLDGHTNRDIAGRMDVSERAIERALSEIRSTWGERLHVLMGVPSAIGVDPRRMPYGDG
jgi:DNA-directed RNA polymerase specialized sigma24 family protein